MNNISIIIQIIIHILKVIFACGLMVSVIKMMKLAIIGSRGIPAKYGGFETFVEEISKRLVDVGYDVYVSCEGGINPKMRQYNGVNLFYFPLTPFYRTVYETIYDVYSLIISSVMFDCIYMLGYGAGFFFFIPKLFRKKLIVNVDGIEWRRDKYNSIEKKILYLSEKSAVYFSDIVIADSVEIKKYIDSCYSNKAVYISYGVNSPSKENWVQSKLYQICNDSNFLNLKQNNYYLVVSRLEPENNILEIIKGFIMSKTNKPLVVVGNFTSNSYKSKITDLLTEANLSKKVLFIGGVYNLNLLNMLRQNCFVYLHGHSAGGTNPSLLESMAMKNIIIAHDNEFNREVGENAIMYFKNSVDLNTVIENIENNYSNYCFLKHSAYDRVIAHYSWKDIASKYDILFQNKEVKIYDK